jgi:hypothetical protein
LIIQRFQHCLPDLPNEHVEGCGGIDAIAQRDRVQITANLVFEFHAAPSRDGCADDDVGLARLPVQEYLNESGENGEHTGPARSSIVTQSGRCGSVEPHRMTGASEALKRRADEVERQV